VSACRWSVVNDVVHCLTTDIHSLRHFTDEPRMKHGCIDRSLSIIISMKYTNISFLVTVYKTVRPMLSCLSCLSVTLVYCGQMVRCIKMKLGTGVGLSPSHIVLDGDQPPPLQKW